MSPFYAEVADRAGHRCEYCRAPESVFNFPFEVEHIVSTSRDGDTTLDNLALACHARNRFKSNYVTCTDPQTETTVALYHTRTGAWADHFEVDRGNGTIASLTPIGRGTIARLPMNRDQHVSARLWWMQIELFP